ncbi:PTS sugar transporter subunit IIA [Streptococcus merionis]|uniref:PTS system, N-acetylgalactosamine-specific IIA component n=1 Tax=Streptococcus merionis TaxID=400065 RepID=A0A239SKR9_9STRE|nr:PTS sugar transporter subunit IIA [Streptococcus merionis]SNU85996.1 PTS system, N-acetylgalactosamine-specific IIA component [Streptococcus merionis]
MTKLIIIGHGRFAEGILSSARLIAGEQEKVEAINFLEEMTAEDVKSKLLESIGCHEQVLVCCDLLGGTPFKVASLVMEEKPDVKMDVLSGLNLAMLLEAIFERELTTTISDLVDKLVTSGRAGIMNWQALKSQETEDFSDGI